MTFLPEQFCTCAQTEDRTLPPSGDFLLAPGGLWVGVVSSGRCAVGTASALAGPGDCFSGAGPLLLHAPAPCHVAAVCLTGEIPGGLSAAPLLFSGVSCPQGGEHILGLCGGGQSPGRRSALAYALLCALSEAEPPEGGLPPLAAEAIGLMRESYATLYGIEELSETMGVSKCHLVRVFSDAVGVPPGQYLTTVRLAAAKELLRSGEYTLETVAGLCGFSGANYFCRVFRRAEGCTPTDWRARAGPRRSAPPLPSLL